MTERMFSEHSRKIACINLKRLWQYSQALCKLKLSKIPVRWEVCTECHSSVRYFSIIASWRVVGEGESIFFKGMALVGQSSSMTNLTVKNCWAAQMELIFWKKKKVMQNLGNMEENVSGRSLREQMNIIKI